MLTDVLSHEIQGWHARMEALPFFHALAEGRLPLESYVGQLRAMALLQGTLDLELSLLAPGGIKELMQDRPSRLIHLRKDLGVLDALALPELQAALVPTRKLAGMIRTLRAGQPTDLIGVLYVLEGTTLGNTVHLPEVLAAFGHVT